LETWTKMLSVRRQRATRCFGRLRLFSIDSERVLKNNVMLSVKSGPTKQRNLEREKAKADLMSSTREGNQIWKRKREMNACREQIESSAKATIGKINTLTSPGEVITLVKQNPHTAVLSKAIHRLSKLGHLRKALQLWDELKDSIELNEVVFGAVMNVCQKLGRVEQCKVYYEELVAHGFTPNVIHKTILMRAYVDLSPIRAIDTFKDIPMWERTPACYTTALKAFKTAEQYEQGWAVWKESLNQEVDQGFLGYTAILSLAARAGWIDTAENLWHELVSYAARTGEPLNRVCYNTLMRTFAHLGQIERVEALIAEMEQKNMGENLFSHCCRIECLFQKGSIAEALKSFLESCKQGIFNLEHYSTSRNKRERVDLHEMTGGVAAIAAYTILLKIRNEYQREHNDVVEFPLRFNVGSSYKFKDNTSTDIVSQPVKDMVVDFLGSQDPPLEVSTLTNRHGNINGLEVSATSLKRWCNQSA